MLLKNIQRKRKLEYLSDGGILLAVLYLQKYICVVRFSLCRLFSRIFGPLRSCIESGLPFIQMEPRRFVPRVVKLTADLTRDKIAGEA